MTPNQNKEYLVKMGDLVNGVVSAVVGAFSAYIFNLIHWKIARAKDKKEQYLLAIQKKVEQYENVCLRYWSSSNESGDSYNHLEKVTRQEYEAQIKNLFQSLNRHISNCFSAFFNEKERSNKESVTYNLLGKLFDVSTGGEFEQENRCGDLKKVGLISSICTDISIELQRSVM